MGVKKALKNRFMKNNNTAKIVLIVVVILSIGLLLYKYKDGYREGINDAEKHRKG